MNIEKTIQVFVYFLIHMCALYTLKSFFNIYLKKTEKNIVKSFFINIIYVLIASTIFLFINTGVANIFIQIFLGLLVSEFFIGQYRKKLLIVVCFISLMVIIELFVEYTVGNLYLSLFIKYVDAPTNDFINKFIGLTVSTLLSLVLVKVLGQYVERKQDNASVSVIDIIKTITLPIFSIILMHIIHTLSIYANTDTTNLVLASILILLISNVYFYVVFDRAKLVEKTCYQNKLLKEQTLYYIDKQNILNEHYKDIRAIKHNLKYQFQYIQDKLMDLTEENVNILLSKIQELLGRCEDKSEEIYTSHKSINTILNYKIDIIKKLNIPLDIKVNVNQDFSIDESSLYVVLGNLLDNAIENFNSSKSAQKTLIIRIYEEHNNLYIKFSNPYAHRITFRKNSIATSKTNKDLHGIGIESIKKIIHENNGIVKTSLSKNIFLIEIIFFAPIEN